MRECSPQRVESPLLLDSLDMLDGRWFLDLFLELLSWRGSVSSGFASLEAMAKASDKTGHFEGSSFGRF